MSRINYVVGTQKKHHNETILLNRTASVSVRQFHLTPKTHDSINAYMYEGHFLCSLRGRFNENGESKCIHHAYI